MYLRYTGRIHDHDVWLDLWLYGDARFHNHKLLRMTWIADGGLLRLNCCGNRHLSLRSDRTRSASADEFEKSSQN